MTRRSPFPLLVATALVAAGLSGCSGDDTDVLLVFAAASLTDAFEELERVYERDHPDTDVQFSFAGSSSLQEQVLAGAPADVFVSADRTTMDRAVEAGAVDVAPVDFARNRIVVAVPESNPGSVTGIDDLGRSELLVGLCAEPVPCGAAARRVLAEAAVTPALDTEEPDVRALTTRLAEAELDVGMVYRTEVLADDRVDAAATPSSAAGDTIYQAAALAEAPDPSRAQRFVDFLLSAEAVEVLDARGFTRP